MDRFMKIVSVWKVLSIFTKHSILDVWRGSEYASESRILECFNQWRYWQVSKTMTKSIEQYTIKIYLWSNKHNDKLNRDKWLLQKNFGKIKQNTNKHLPRWRCVQDMSKMCWRHLQPDIFLSSYTSSRRVFKTSSWWHLKDILQTRHEDVLKIS